MTSSRIRTHLKVAKAYAAESHAKLLKVGAVIIQDDRPIMVGYNGTPPGWDSNECEIDGETKPEVIHAEMNAIGYCAKKGIATEGCTIVITHVPCFRCAKLILAAGVKEVYYESEFKQTDSLDFLRKGKVKVEQI